MIWKKHPADASDFPGDSEERHQAAIAVAGTTDPVEVHISDYGDFEGDHSEAVHRYTNAESSSHIATPDETERYYDSTRGEDIKIRER